MQTWKERRRCAAGASPAIFQEGARVRSGCNAACGRHCSSGGCHSARSVVGALLSTVGGLCLSLQHAAPIVCDKYPDTAVLYSCRSSTMYEHLDILHTYHVTSITLGRQHISALESRGTAGSDNHGHYSAFTLYWLLGPCDRHPRTAATIRHVSPPARSDVFLVGLLVGR